MTWILVEYIWLDSTNALRSKIRTLPDTAVSSFLKYTWDFDEQTLIPLRIYKSPAHFSSHAYYFLLCESVSQEETHRSILTGTLQTMPKKLSPTIGFEQEYFLFETKTGTVIDAHHVWIKPGTTFCGQSKYSIDVHKLMRTHAEWCLEASIMFAGYNLEEAPGQYKFKIGPRIGNASELGGLPIKGESCILKVCDDLIMARFLLHKVCELYALMPVFEPKPFVEENGSGCHTDFAVSFIRNADKKEKSKKRLEKFIEILKFGHTQVMEDELYGVGNKKRLCGKHGAIDYKHFTGSIRIKTGNEYIQDKRPAANCNPYIVANYLCSMSRNASDT